MHKLSVSEVHRQRVALWLLSFAVVLPTLLVAVVAVLLRDWPYIALGLSLVVSVGLTTMVYMLFEQLSGRLHSITIDINSMAADLNEKYSDYRGAVVSDQEIKTNNELLYLEKSVGLLRKRLEIANKIESAIEIERERAHTSSKMASLGELVAGISHEINNPVTVIYGLSDELQRRADELTSEEIKKTAVRISKTATRISSIVKTLLRFSRNVTNDPKELHSVKELINDAVVLVQDQFRQANIFLEVEPVDLNIFVHCRPIQISQVILNLLNNASDALEFSSVRWIRLQVKQVAATVYISVTDSGPGISLSIQSRLMQPFATTKAPGRGTGLGLSLSKQMIEEHDGTLFVDWKSEATRFVIQLPSPTGLETFRTPPSDN